MLHKCFTLKHLLLRASNCFWFLAGAFTCKQLLIFMHWDSSKRPGISKYFCFYAFNPLYVFSPDLSCGISSTGPWWDISKSQWPWESSSCLISWSETAFIPSKWSCPSVKKKRLCYDFLTEKKSNTHIIIHSTFYECQKLCQLKFF